MSLLGVLIVWSVLVDQVDARPPENARDGPAILSALQGRDEAAKLAALQTLEPLVRESAVVARAKDEYARGVRPIAEIREVRFPEIGLSLTGILPPIAAGLDSKNPEVRFLSAGIIVDVGMPLALPILPELLELLRTAGPDGKGAILQLLVNLAPYPDDRIPQAVLGCWDDSDRSVRTKSFELMLSAIERSGGGIDSGADVFALVEPLRRHLSDRSAESRLAAVRCLSALGMVARPVRDEIVRLLGEPDPAIRFAASCAILRIDGRRKNVDAERARDLFMELVDQYAPKTFTHEGFSPDLPRFDRLIAALGARAVPRVVAVLKTQQERGEESSRDLPRHLRDRSYYIDSYAIQTLGYLGAQASAAIPFLEQVLPYPESPAWTAAASAVASIDPANGILLSALRVQLESGEPGLRQHAVWALARCGPSAKPLIRALEKQLAEPADDPSKLRDLVANAVWRIDPDHRRARTIVLDNLRSGRAWSVSYSIETLGLQGSQAREAVPLLVDLASSSPEYSTRLSCHAALLCMDPSREESFEAIVQGLKSNRPQHQSYAIAALEKIGPRARKAIPLLSELTRSRTRWIRESADDLLVRLERLEVAPAR